MVHDTEVVFLVAPLQDPCHWLCRTPGFLGVATPQPTKSQVGNALHYQAQLGWEHDTCRAPKVA